MYKMIFATVISLFAIQQSGFSYNDFEPPVLKDTVFSFTDVDITPEPIIGMPEFYNKWSLGVKYPVKARRNGVQGRVFIYFIVDQAGQITEYGIERSLGSGCDEAALEAFKNVNSKWKPGMKDGVNVTVKMVIPFTFKLG